MSKENLKMRFLIISATIMLAVIFSLYSLNSDENTLKNVNLRNFESGYDAIPDREKARFLKVQSEEELQLKLNCDIELNCTEPCPVGYMKDERGCFNCTCLKHGVFQGDVMIDENQYEELVDRYQMPLKNNYSVRKKRASYTSYHNWPKIGSNKNVIIPYTMEGISNENKKKILAAMNEFKRKTCVRFIQRRRQEFDHLVFRSSDQCNSYVGKIGGAQTINMVDGYCFVHGTILHEMMHALGFEHEQNRPDRDRYVTINYNNLKSGSELFYAKIKSYKWEPHGSPYDINSVMHYSSYDGAKEWGKPVMTNKKGKQIYAQRKDFSTNDVIQINKKYKCARSYLVKATEKPRKVSTEKSSVNVQSKCVDKSSASLCLMYKQKGRCTDKKFRSFTEINCNKTCNFCNKKTITTTTKPTPLRTKFIRRTTKTTTRPTTTKRTTTRGGTMGSIVTTPRFRTTYRPTVRTTTEATYCQDTDKNCGPWKSLGYCTKLRYRFSMRKSCRLTCGFCKPTKTTTIRTTRKPKTTRKNVRTTTKPTTKKIARTTVKPTSTSKLFVTKRSRTTKKLLRTIKPITTNRPSRTTIKPRSTKKPIVATQKVIYKIRRTTTKRPQSTKRPFKERTTPFTELVTKRTKVRKVTTRKPLKTTTFNYGKVNTTSKPGQCIDKYQYCEAWAKAGYCKAIRYRLTMKKNCQLSCSYCSISKKDLKNQKGV